ncbi:cation transporter [Kocuria sp. NPDC057446]|uniref:cation transporter n=1 Tax=Kocuria sp. NPDC057446 TaxID=3346137 RepID=UPI00369E106D
MRRVPEQARFGATELTDEQSGTLRRAVRLEWITIGVLVLIVAAVELVAGQSQAMKTAWVEDMLSFLPPIAFLAAARIARRPPTPRHPYGYHRAVGVGHLVAAVALLGMGATLVIDSGTALLTGDRPPIGVLDVPGNLRGSVADLVDARATTFDDAAPHPLIQDVTTVLRQQPWVQDVGVRVRDEGHVFHVEAFVVPAAGALPTLEQLAAARKRCADLDWKVEDVVVAPVAELPEHQVPR